MEHPFDPIDEDDLADRDPGDDVELSIRGAPILRVLGTDNFPCLDDDQRDALAGDALATARAVRLACNAVAGLPPPAEGEVRVIIEGPAGGDKHRALAALVLDHLRRTGAGLFVAGGGEPVRFGDPALGGTPFTVVVRDRD